MLYYLLDLLTLGCISGIMVLGFNLQYGYAGILNFTYYTFVAVGAYIAAVTTMGPPNPNVGQQTYILQWTLPWPVGLLLGGLAAAAVGLFVVFIAVRRLRSDYLAIVTVSVGLIIWNLITNDVPLFDGSNGVFGVPPITGNLPISSENANLVMLALSFVVMLICFWVVARIYNSPFGRMLRAIREDVIVAQTFGKSVMAAQVWTFAIGCFMGGISGGLLVFYISAWNPASFLPLESFVLLSAIVIGGTGSYWGALLGAFAIVEGLAEVTRFLPTFGRPDLVGAVRGMAIGIVLILVLRYRPDGLIPERPLSFYRKSKSKAPSKAEATKS